MGARAVAILIAAGMLLSACNASGGLPSNTLAARDALAGTAPCTISRAARPIAPAYANTVWPSEHHDPWRTHAAETGLPARLSGRLRAAIAKVPPVPVWGYVGLDGDVYVIGGSPYLLDVFTKLILGAPSSSISVLIAESLRYSATLTPYVAQINPSTMAVRTLPLTRGSSVNYTGGMLVDSNGYLYAVARSVLYKIDPKTFTVVASRMLPLAPNSKGRPDPLTAYNGMQATLNGDLILKGFASVGSSSGILLRIDPATLSIKAHLESTQIAASRMTLVTLSGQQYIYLVGATDSTRILIQPKKFAFDDGYSQQYLFPDSGTTEGTSDVFMGQGVAFTNNTSPAATASMSIFAQGANDGSQLQSQPAFNGSGAGWDFFMPAGDPFKTGIVAVEDQVTGHISGFAACDGGANIKKLWENDAIAGSAGMAIDTANGQLYADDHHCLKGKCTLSLVVLSLRTGKELARTTVAGSEPTIGQIFIGPRNRVFYLATDTDKPNGYITRVTAP